MRDLLLDIGQMREADARIERTYATDALRVDADLCRMAGPLHLDFTVHKNKDQFRLAGRVRTTIELSCCRCLTEYPMAVDEAFDILFLPHAETRPDAEVEIEDDDLSSAYYREQVIDLGQLMQEQIYLAVPMKPLCSERCRGLCPQCGINLNMGSCACTTAWEDPRLAVLRNLKKDE